MDKLVSAIVVWTVVFLLESLIFGSGGFAGFIIKGFIATFPAVAIARLDLPIWSALTTGGTSSEPIVQPPNTKITPFGQEIDRPAFLNKVRNFYGRPLPTWAFYGAKGGAVGCAGIPPLPATPLNERRMFESMTESARYEMMVRGLPYLDHLNRAVWPAVEDVGMVIETITRKDGSQAWIVATDLHDPLGRDEWQRASQAGIGHIESAWQQYPYANVREYYVPGKGKVQYDDPGSGIMPLYRLLLEEIPLPPDEEAPVVGNTVRPDMPDAWR